MSIFGHQASRSNTEENLITITGASGNLGSKITERLLKAGHKVRLIARRGDRMRSFGERGAELAVGSLTDTAFLTRAFRASDVVLTMMPADYDCPDVRAYQRGAAESIAAAVKASGVSRIVNNSSLGAHLESGNGMVGGLALLEEKLNAIPGRHVLHLRPTYFMENLLASIGIIRQMGFFGSNIRDDVAFPLVATQDIAAIAAEKLARPQFKGTSVLPVLGPRDYTFKQVASALGAAIGKPVAYQVFPAAQVKAALTGMGLSASMADAYVGLGDGINNGMMGHDARTAEATTPTTIDEFAALFAGAYAAA
jgi:uncharacterized protein YbjT (DUF2867 family)